MAVINTTSDFENRQTTYLYQHNSLKSNEINRLVESIGIGKNYIASNFDINFAVSEAIENRNESLFVTLTPGIIVQDYTVINFQDYYNNVNSINPYDKFINIFICTIDDMVSSGDSLFIGCSYYHGTYGDAINASPTYATIMALKWNSGNGFGLDYPHFVPFYKLSFLESYGGISDFNNIKVERVIPHLKYDGPGQPIEAYKTVPENFSVYGGGYDDDDGDAGLLWAVVL